MPVNPVLSTPRLTGLPVMRAPAYRVPSVYLETGEDVIEHADDLLSSQPAPLQDQDWKDLEKITGTSLIVPGGSAAVPSAPKNPPPPSDMMRFRSQRAVPQYPQSVQWTPGVSTVSMMPQQMMMPQMQMMMPQQQQQTYWQPQQQQQMRFATQAQPLRSFPMSDFFQTPVNKKRDVTKNTAGKALDRAWDDISEAVETTKAKQDTVASNKYMESLKSAMDTLPRKHEKRETKPRFSVPDIPRDADKMWKETADLLKKAGSSSKDGGDDSRFRTEAKVTSREALEAFYAHFNPEKVDHVDSILKRYDGHRDLLWERLKHKYGEAPSQERALKRRKIRRTRMARSGQDEVDEKLREGYDNPAMAIVEKAALREELRRSEEVGRRISSLKKVMH